MTPKEYCYQKAAPPGSALYFSLRGLTSLQKDKLVAIYAFYREIEDITLADVDPISAHAKLNWWRSEIDNKQPSHPIALALQQISDPDSLIKIIDGLEQNLTFPIFETFEDVAVHLIRTAGARELLMAKVLLNNEQIDPETIYKFMLVIELVIYLQHLHRYVRRGIIYFAQDEMQKYKVTEEMLHEFVTTSAICDLLKLQADKIEKSYQKAKAALPKNIKPQLFSLLSRCEICRAVLKAIKSSDFNVLENFIDITPLRKWWIAFKNIKLKE